MTSSQPRLKRRRFGAEIGVLTSLNDFAVRPARGSGMARSFPSAAAG